MKMNKYQKMAKEAPNLVLIQDVEYGIRANNNAKRAIYASISQGVFRVDEGYIKEKLTAIRDIDKWLHYYIREVDERNKSGNLSMELMVRFGDIILSPTTLFS